MVRFSRKRSPALVLAWLGVGWMVVVLAVNVVHVARTMPSGHDLPGLGHRAGLHWAAAAAGLALAAALRPRSRRDAARDHGRGEPWRAFD